MSSAPSVLTDAALPPLAHWLVSGGDVRLALNAQQRNRYHCPVMPQPDRIEFSSSTASSISHSAWQACDDLLARLDLPRQGQTPADDHAAYALAMEQLRDTLKTALQLPEGTQQIFAASGTDAHLIAAQLAAARAAPSGLSVLGAGAAETGSGVPAALLGQHVSTLTPTGRTAREGEAIPQLHAVDWQGIALRTAAGLPRRREDIDTEFTALISTARAQGRSVLVILTDVSKTGLVAPAVDSVLAWQQRWPQHVQVLVDACQWRLDEETLRRYLAQGWAVAVSGSKFLAGPIFSAALLLPAHLQWQVPPPCGLAWYSHRGDWPADWPGIAALPAGSNWGLRLRWEAAWHELQPWLNCPAQRRQQLLSALGTALTRLIDSFPRFERLPAPPPARAPLGVTSGWDVTPSIWPIRLQHADGRWLHLAETRALEPALDGRLGQSVACGWQGDTPVGALRLCLSARQILAAEHDGGHGILTAAQQLLISLDARLTAR